MRQRLWLIVLGCSSLAGCTAAGPREKFRLPEDSYATTSILETLVPVGMPIEVARRTLEQRGFVCTYENTLGIPYLHCEQVKPRHLWPFRGIWTANIYHDGFVRSVQGRYDIYPVEVGRHIPPRAAEEARAVHNAHDRAMAAHEVVGPVAPMTAPVVPEGLIEDDEPRRP